MMYYMIILSMYITKSVIMFKISIENPGSADAETIAYLNVNTWKDTYIDLLPRDFVEGKK